jgi:transposase
MKRGEFSRKDRFPAFSPHTDNSMCHNGNKISEKLAKGSIERAPRPPYSPDISPCGFWLSGMLKHKMKDRELHSQQVILSPVAKA